MWNLILSAGLQIIKFVLDRSEAEEKQKRAFLKFLSDMEPHNKTAGRLRKSYKSQEVAALEKIKKANEVKK